jgi:hypothetical protein
MSTPITVIPEMPGIIRDFLHTDSGPAAGMTRRGAGLLHYPRSDKEKSLSSPHLSSQHVNIRTDILKKAT